MLVRKPARLCTLTQPVTWSAFLTGKSDQPRCEGFPCDWASQSRSGEIALSPCVDPRSIVRHPKGTAPPATRPAVWVPPRTEQDPDSIRPASCFENGFQDCRYRRRCSHDGVTPKSCHTIWDLPHRPHQKFADGDGSLCRSVVSGNPASSASRSHLLIRTILPYFHASHYHVFTISITMFSRIPLPHFQIPPSNPLAEGVSVSAIFSFSFGFCSFPS
ncbi:MAG: hypothetical protein BWY82_02758 [Verrucomicrobia bacterium ADurb.Bin474]|nr:MAG: hypothetical protein BWY82_02758 [Verrucomicrobia bacterium ADurb.Bin474]